MVRYDKYANGAIATRAGTGDNILLKIAIRWNTLPIIRPLDHLDLCRMLNHTKRDHAATGATLMAESVSKWIPWSGVCVDCFSIVEWKARLRFSWPGRNGCLQTIGDICGRRWEWRSKMVRAFRWNKSTGRITIWSMLRKKSYQISASIFDCDTKQLLKPSRYGFNTSSDGGDFPENE